MLLRNPNLNLNRTLITFLDKCKSMLQLNQIHALVITLGLSQDNFFMSKIVSFSALSDSNNTDYSYRALLNLQDPTIFDWNTVIMGYSKSKNPNKSISVFVKMLQVGIYPDHLTYPFLAKATSRLLRKELGVSIHGHVIKSGFEIDRFIANSLVHMYGSCGDIVYARRVFDGVPVKNLVSWNSMIDGYAKCGYLDLARGLFDLMPERDVRSWSCLIDGYAKSGNYGDAMAVFEKMRTSGPKANEVTMVSVLCACAHLGALDKGRMMHRYLVDNGFELNLVLQTSLVDMYAKCGAVEEAFAVFRGVSLRKSDVLIWNAMIGGLATHGLVKESLDLYTEMQIVGIKPDEITFLCLLSACAHGGLVKQASYFFEGLGKNGMTPKTEHYACMVDVMARAGQVAEAYQFLCQMPVEPTASMLDLAELVGKKLIELDPKHAGRYIGLSNVYAIGRRWDEARIMREAMERRGVKKTPGYSFLEMSGAHHRFIAHDESHPSSEHIYTMLSFIVSQMQLGGVLDEGQEHRL
ncbi:pentatricopeptide repeat-containing protein [Salix suchowensis]|nr:pentatricopeptide repeat-containing protein [Salix suchowensis]